MLHVRGTLPITAVTFHLKKKDQGLMIILNPCWEYLSIMLVPDLSNLLEGIIEYD